jgi:hypothetical protein
MFASRTGRVISDETAYAISHAATPDDLATLIATLPAPSLPAPADYTSVFPWGTVRRYATGHLAAPNGLCPIVGSAVSGCSSRFSIGLGHGLRSQTGLTISSLFYGPDKVEFFIPHPATGTSLSLGCHRAGSPVVWSSRIEDSHRQWKVISNTGAAGGFYLQHDITGGYLSLSDDHLSLILTETPVHNWQIHLG